MQVNGIHDRVSHKGMYELTQSMTTQMAVKIGLNAIGRPGFIIIDNSLDPETKKYSAAKEFLYQALSFALYVALIMPVFKKGLYKLAGNVYKDENVFKAFKTPKEFKEFFKLSSETEKVNKLNELSKNGDVFTRENISKDSEDLANGVVEASSLIGTIVGMAIIAPIAATQLIHPIMDAIGLSKKEAKPVETNNDNE